jgi:murein DD-endopeptidase MepM/ murein hydrolase activator NlpD
MSRSTLLALVVASAAAVLATSVVPAGLAAPGAGSVARPGARSSSSPAGPTSGSHQRASDAAKVGLQRRGGRAAMPGAREGPSPEARRGAMPEAGVRGRWRWPLRPRPSVLRPFRAPVSTYGAGHRGLDLAAAAGDPVLAVEGGVVTHSGMVAGRGTVTVAHVGGLSSTYEPVDPHVAVGAVVSVGDMLGTFRARDGPGHCGGRTCLHLGARRGEAYLDPYPLLAGGRPVLLPVP